MGKIDLTNGNIKTVLLRFALPLLASNLLQALYGAVDLYVVGKFNGASAISAVNIGSQIMQIITGIVTGCTMGSTVLIGFGVGQGNQKLAAKALGNTVTLFAVVGALLTPIMVLLSGKMVVWMQTPPDALQEAAAYVLICSLGIPFITVFNVCASILRGVGDSNTPMRIVGVACLANIAGDFLLGGALHMGVTGVAIATSCAQMLSSIYGILSIRAHGLPFPVVQKDLAPDKEVIRRMLAVGIPIAAQDTLVNLYFMIVTVIANMRGLTDSSAVGVVEKVIMFMFLVPISLLSAVSAITAQNIGAGKPERALQARNFGILLGIVFGGLVCAVSWLCPERLTGIFTSDAAVLQSANEYIKTYSIDCILYGITSCLIGYLNGMGRSTVTFAQSVVTIVFVRTPAAYLLSHAFPHTLLPMGAASAMGSTVSIIIFFFYFRAMKQKQAAAP